MLWNASKRNNPFMEYNHIEIINVETDHAVLKLEIQPESRNLWGTLHGGAMCTMADNAVGIALSTDGRIYVTQNCYMSFIGNQESGIVFAEAWVCHRGKTTFVVNVEVKGMNENLIATGKYSFYCLGTR